MSAANCSGFAAAPAPVFSKGTSRPVMPSSTTSGMPPVALATTAVSHAMASRLTIPSGSYTDGHTNTVAFVRIWMTSGLGSILSSQMMLPRWALTLSTLAATSAPISGVSGAPAHSTIWADGSMSRAASSRWGTPFCRVMRPTKTIEGLAGSMP
jgi:hypothetical protein